MIIHINFTLFVEVILFLAFMWLLNRIFYQPLSAVFRERSARVEAGLRAAEESRRGAEETQRAVQQRLDEARNEARAAIAMAGKEVNAQRQALLAETREQANALVQQAAEEIRQERQNALEGLRREAGELAILAASRVVGSSLDSTANRQVADRAIADAGGVR